MTGKEIIDMIGIALDDIDHGSFAIPLKVNVANMAVSKIYGRLYPQYKTQMQKEKSGVPNDFDIQTLKTVDGDDIRGGINCIRSVYIQQQSRYAIKISREEYIKNINAGLGENPAIPKYYIDGTKLKLLPSTMTADIVYEINPGKLAYIDSRPDVFLDEKFDSSIIDLSVALFKRDKNAELLAYQELKSECNEFSGTDTNKHKVMRRPNVPHDPQWDNL